jgi:hypothetical protein
MPRFTGSIHFNDFSGRHVLFWSILKFSPKGVHLQSNPLDYPLHYTNIQKMTPPLYELTKCNLEPNVLTLNVLKGLNVDELPPQVNIRKLGIQNKNKHTNYITMYEISN